MTAQIHDLVLLGDSTYNLVGSNGEGLFAPDVHGLTLRAPSTACWRGHRCLYGIREDQLLLETLFVSCAAAPPTVLKCSAQKAEVPAPMVEIRGEQAPVFGASVIPDPQAGGCEFAYRDMRAAVQYTGGLLLGRGFLKDLYVHMGFHPAWKFEEVVEVVLDDGRVRSQEDRSPHIAELRRKLKKEPLEPGRDADPHMVRDWISGTFRMDYEL